MTVPSFLSYFASITSLHPFDDKHWWGGDKVLSHCGFDLHSVGRVFLSLSHSQIITQRRNMNYKC